MRMSVRVSVVLIAFLCACGGARRDVGEGAASAPREVTLTWLSVTNWLLEAGDTRILLDGYVSRINSRTVNADGSSSAPAPLEIDSVARVRDTVLPAGDLDWVLVGHGHWDHAFDTPTWAKLTDARIGGARTVCHQVVAFEVDKARCSAFEGGEVFEVGTFVRVRVVRWHHSGDSATANGRRLRAPLELRAPPSLDPVAGGLRPGFLEDYPNGGGSRAYLITVVTEAGPVTLFWSNTGNPQAWEEPVPADSAFFRTQDIDVTHLEWATSETPTREHLAEALKAEGLDAVDLWIGWAGIEHVGQVTSVLRPRTFTPQHWDDFWTPLNAGLHGAFQESRIKPTLAEAGVRLLVPKQYFDRIVVSPREIVRRATRRSDRP